MLQGYSVPEKGLLHFLDRDAVDMQLIRTCWRSPTVFVLTLALSPLGGGCNSATSPVKIELAQQTLSSTLDSWKAGKSPDDLSPKVIVQDFDWSGGVRLLDYEITNDQKPLNSNLYVKVALRMGNLNGQETRKTVTYVVSTTPGLTVFRDITK